MTTPLIADVQFTSHGLATTITLPTRPPSPLRFFGCVPMAIGGVIFLMSSGWAFALLTGLHNAPPIPLEGPPPPPRPDYVLSLCTIPFFLLALWLVYAGLRALLPNAVRIQITDTHLRLITRAGPFPKTRARALAEISQLRIADVYPGLQFSSAGEPARCSLLIDCKTQPMLTVAGYYRETIIAAANLLADELQRRHLPVQRPLLDAASTPENTEPMNSAPAPVETSTEAMLSSESPPSVPEDSSPPSAPPVQPSTSTIVYLPAADSLTFMVPRTGVKGVAVFFLIFSLIWNSISGIIFIASVFAFISRPSLENILPLLFISFFLAIGFVMFLAFLQTAFRKAVILATAQSLIVTQQGPIRSKEFQWTPAELKSIAAEHSGTTINNRRLKELRFNLATGAHHGFFDGRDDDELEWLAHTLRHYYNL